MSVRQQNEQAPVDSRAGADLQRHYRPIGIGAVTAALSAAGKPVGGQARDATEANDRRREESMAA